MLVCCFLYQLVLSSYALDLSQTNCTDISTAVEASHAVIWHQLVCPDISGKKQTINLLDIDLNNQTIKILPIKTVNQLATVPVIASTNPSVVAGINGSYFYNADTNTQYKDPSCPTKIYPQLGDLGDSLLQINHQVQSLSCDNNGDGTSHLSRTTFAMDDEGHAYITSVSPNKPLKNLKNSKESNVAYAVSGGPNLISVGADGKGFVNITDEGFDHLERKAARTAIGISQDNHMYWVTVDGKSPSPGMTINELANFMLHHLQVSTAMNLDGGGSTTLCINLPNPANGNNCTVVNQPSDAGGARKIHDGLFIVTNQ